jgi:CBS domain containing-hemolysin-like protein
LLGGAELPALWAVAFLAAVCESALRHASLARLEEAGADRLARERYARYLEGARTLAGLCACVRVAAGTAMAGLIVLRAGRERGSVPAALAAAAALLVAAEAGGRLIGRKWAGILRLLLPALYWASWPLRAAPSWARRRPAERQEPQPEVVEAAKEEIRVAIEDGTAEGALEAEEKEMIEGIMRFGEVDVAQIMTPRTEMECLQADTALPAAVLRLSSLRHSRVPVYEGTLDRIVGIVYVKDLLAAVARADASAATVRQVMRQPLFVPETKTLDALLEQFQREHVQIALVLDEYGGVSGLVTVEDIMEEIVGEIQDEYDQEDHENRIRRRSSGGVEVDARVRIDELNDLFDLDIPEDEDYDTVGGYVTACLARVPKPGEELRAHGLLVRVLHSEARRVRRVFLRRLEPEESER